MTRFPIPLLLVLAVSGCVAPIPAVEVTRFHTGQASYQGLMVIRAAEGLNAESLEFRTYAMAVTKEMTSVGLIDSQSATSPWVAEIAYTRGTLTERAKPSPVSIGIGGGTSSGGVGIGVGTSFPLGGGGTRETVITRLSVRLLSRLDGKPVWEGRAETQAPASAPASQPGLAAAKLASALFTGFPGKSGETITVK
jgi:hypothetical protein